MVIKLCSILSKKNIFCKLTQKLHVDLELNARLKDAGFFTATLMACDYLL